MTPFSIVHIWTSAHSGLLKALLMLMASSLLAGCGSQGSPTLLPAATAPQAAAELAVSDGVDPDSCQDVHIANCNIECYDDAICLKASFALGSPVSCNPE